MRRAAALWLALLALPALALAQSSANDSPVATAPPVPAYIVREIPDARAAGRGKLTWFGLQVYDARLYVPERGFDASDFASQRFALEMTYARRLDGKSIAGSSGAEIEKLGFGTGDQRAGWLREMTKIFPDVAAGQALAGVHLANGATRFYFEGRLIGAIDDPAFGHAFFAIWFDPRTSAPRLRTELLQRAAL